MELRTLSATSASVYESCPARFKAEYVDRVPDEQGEAGALGNAVHATLERWVDSGLYADPASDEHLLKAIYDEVYWDWMADSTQQVEGWNMVKRWYKRTEWEGREVISTEVKTRFPLKIPGGPPLPVTYIYDRLDRLDDGSIEVIDYKTVGQPVTHEQMKNRIQVRLYALAATIAHPDAKMIWVTYDLLRFTPVGVRFTREECIATYKYLQHLAKRITESDGSVEKINPECRFCVRRWDCDTLKRHIDGGGRYGAAPGADVATMAAERGRLAVALGVTKGMLDTLDEQLLLQMQADNVTEVHTDEWDLTIGSRGTRRPDSERITKVVGAELAAEYGSLGVGDIEKMLTDDRLTDEQKSQVARLMPKTFGNPYITTKPRLPLDE